MNHKVLLSCAAVLVGTSSVLAAPVWQSTFDSNADGVVDIYTGNAEKVMIGSVSSGKLEITTQDNGGAEAYSPDRAGRSLGTAQVGTDSFSGLYRFSWSTLNTTASEITEAVGFIGNHSAQSRQFVGGRLRHYQIGGDYLVGLDVAFGSTGHLVENFAVAAGPLPNYAINLGPNALSTDYQLAVGWDGVTRTVSLALYDDQGTLLGQHTGTITVGSAMTPSSSQVDLDAEVADLSVGYLGWGDYTSYGNDVTTVWNVDSLAYFDSANGAFEAAVPEPGAISLLGLAALALRRRRK
ncbi:MAG: PEP-CTERM sorting domain-containing protein [Phycisphaerales bacterium]|jgi:MYXO-CTERM domain-containing protein|nr:PEP-CTERM sorting domain-containing protein [Phycisphaerales bacterium]